MRNRAKATGLILALILGGIIGGCNPGVTRQQIDTTKSRCTSWAKQGFN
ncbi:hypothetical protein QF028_002587 [Neobacillus sp. B4I6]